MTKYLLYIPLFLLTFDSVFAQPTKQNVAKTQSEAVANITMADFEYQASRQQNSSFAPFRAMQTKPGIAMLGSAIVPGLGQAANRKWIRAGAYLAADLIFLGVHLHSFNQAREREQQYEEFANNNWSVVTYARWLVDYHEANAISNPYIDELRQQVESVDPAYNPEQDWQVVNIDLLRNVEENTPFVTPEGSGNSFSHHMPEYGSQQYYELISKYYQYGPGWNDFGSNRNGEPLDNMYQLAWDGSDMPFYFFRGADLSEEFNDKYRLAGNMISYLILNHVVSAFDALLTVKIKNNRLNAETNLFGTRQFILKYHF